MKIRNILIVSIILIFTISLVSSAGFDWRSYCNPITACWQTQFSDAKGRFNEGFSNISIVEGYDTSFRTNLNFQPLVTSFNISGSFDNFLVFPNGNFLQVYDDNLNIVQEVNTGGNALANIDALSWDDVSGFEIAGIWEINSTDVVFRVYSFNTTSNLFAVVFEQNFSTTFRTGFAGLRHSDNNAFFFIPNSNIGGLFQSTFTQINDSGIFNTALINRTCFFDEPLGFDDVDADGNREFLTFCDTEVILFEADGTIEFNVSNKPAESSTVVISDAKIVKADATNQWKIAVYQGESFIEFPSVLNTNAFITMFRLDGTTLWEVSDSDVVEQGRIAIGTFFRVPNWFQRWILQQEAGLETAVFLSESAFDSGGVNNIRFRVLEADDGGVIKSKTFLDKAGWDTIGFDSALTMVDINNNGANDFIWTLKDGYMFYDAELDSIIEERKGVNGAKLLESCIPADLTFDNSQEIICTGQDQTILYSSDFLNQNANIVSLSFDPSTSIQVNTTLTIFINAVDPEGDSPLTFRHRCDTGENFTTESGNPTRQCTFTTIGIKQVTASVHDPFNSTFVDFTTPITVSLGGTVCGDGICEGLETNFNCALDCPFINQTQSTVEGSITIPTELVELENTNQGLLPEIYFGTLAFMSSVLNPTIILVFTIFFVMIMITIGVIIKKIGQKVASI